VRRRRDRRGRGLRGPLAPPHVPLAKTRAERFDELVSDSVQRLERRWADQLSDVEFAVADVPPDDSEAWSAEPVALARLFPANGSQPARIVVYRRPLEARAADRTELGSLIHEVVVEEVATLLGMEPDEIDPRYDEADGDDGDG
jgi:predicted Zn-dependent protease with MMP-like domain